MPPQEIHKFWAGQQKIMAQLTGSSQEAAQPLPEEEAGPEYWSLVHVDSAEAASAPEEAAVARAAGWDYLTLVPGRSIASVFFCWYFAVHSLLMLVSFYSLTCVTKI